MRLLKIETSGHFSLVELEKDKMEPYAILSHMWGESHEEVTFRDLMEKTGEQKVGYDKLKFCARQAEKDEIEYFWVDTCCIDKSSSAELSEAINSMYHWYENAAKCYAYLSDVSCPEESLAIDIAATNFPKSKWFTRGWTLQELIAPLEVVFYSKKWIRIGTKLELAEDLTNITGIDGRVLRGAHPGICSIADRMSWAAKRETTREEDIAYSLLGIFDINMPLLYGERGKAFIRLQEEIIKTSNDQSVFAWKSSDSTFHAGLLATSPKYFEASRGIKSHGFSKRIEPSSMTSRGIRTSFNLEENRAENGTYYARLACYRAHYDHQYAILLQRVTGDTYLRIDSNFLEALGPTKVYVRSILDHIYVKQDLFRPLQASRFLSRADAKDDLTWFWIRGTPDLYFSEPVGASAWYPEIALFGLRVPQAGRVLVTRRAEEEQKMSLLFGTREARLFCKLDESSNSLNFASFEEELGLGRKDQRLIKGKCFMTARMSQEEIRSRPCTVITLCQKIV